MKKTKKIDEFSPPTRYFFLACGGFFYFFGDFLFWLIEVIQTGWMRERTDGAKGGRWRGLKPVAALVVILHILTKSCFYDKLL